MKDIQLEFDDLSGECDVVLASVFKKLFDIVGNLILHILNLSLAGGVFSNRLMLALVVFIFQSRWSDSLNELSPYFIIKCNQ